MEAQVRPWPFRSGSWALALGLRCGGRAGGGICSWVRAPPGGPGGTCTHVVLRRSLAGGSSQTWKAGGISSVRWGVAPPSWVRCASVSGAHGMLVKRLRSGPDGLAICRLCRRGRDPQPAGVLTLTWTPAGWVLCEEPLRPPRPVRSITVTFQALLDVTLWGHRGSTYRIYL